jgi:hypothetical protein
MRRSLLLLALRRTGPCLKRKTVVSPFVVFLQSNENHPRVEGLPVFERAKVLVELFQALSPSAKSQLAAHGEALAQAAKTETKERAKRQQQAMKAREGKKQTEYMKFVQANAKKVDGKDRMNKIAALWKAHKKKKQL